MKHRPDHEMDIMRRGLRDLATLSPASQERVVAYWTARVPTLPTTGDQHGEQQLDIEERLPMRVAGAAA